MDLPPKNKIIGATLLTTSILLGLTLIPLPGINAETNTTIKNTEVPVELYKNNTIIGNSIGVYTSNGDIEYGKINLATGNRGIFDFMSVCTHETIHAELEAKNKEINDHEYIKDKEIAGWIMPWYWKTNCYLLIPDRLNYLSL